MRFTRLSLFLSASLFCLAAFVPAQAGQRPKKPKKPVKELKKELKTVRNKIHEKRVELRQTKRVERKITVEISSVEDRLLKTENHLHQVKTRLKQIDKREKVLVRRMAATKKRLDGRRILLAQRLRDNYEHGNANYMQVLLKSRSVHDYVSRSYYVERIVDSDVRLVAAIRSDSRQLEDDKKELDAQQAEQQVLQADLETQREQYKADVEKKQSLLAEVQDTRETMEEALNELEQASNEIEARIRAQQETPRGRARLAKAWTGHFIKPADGPITSGYGSRFHPILHRTKMHTGVDIGAGYGASIRAAGDGEVIMSGYMRGYGNCVIIDHGGGVSTLYGHCSSLLVSEGQTVHQGQTVAKVGSTGLATGPHLHFEVRRNGTPVNPL